MNLTTLARVRELLKVPSGKTDPDALLNQLIPQVSLAIERWLGREGLIQSAARVEYHDAESDQSQLWLRAFPVTSIAEVANDYDRQFGSSTVIPSTDYAFYPKSGLVRVYKRTLIGGPQAVRVTYTGGIAVDTAALITAAPDLALAAEMQVAFIFQRKNILGSTGSSSQGGGVQLDRGSRERGQTDAIIPEVAGLLEPYRREFYGVGTV